MLRDTRAAYRIEEIQLGPGAQDIGDTLRDARVRERFGMTVLAIRKADNASWTYNPDPGEKIAPGMTLVVLGSAAQVTELRKVCQ
jgi:K+/H+ antiporter YhaU regulatory subunit KhtT